MWEYVRSYVAYSLLVTILGWIARAATCVRPEFEERSGGSAFCQFGPFDLLGGASLLIAGLAIGAVAARFYGQLGRRGPNAMLEGAGAFVIPSVVFTFAANAVGWRGSPDISQLIVVGTVLTVTAGTAAGAVIGLRSRRPIRTAVLLAVVLVALWLYPFGASQLAIVPKDRPEAWLVALPLLYLVTIPLAAQVARRCSAGFV